MGALVATKASRAECIAFAREYLRWARKCRREPYRAAWHLSMAARWRTLARGRA